MNREDSGKSRSRFDQVNRKSETRHVIAGKSLPTVEIRIPISANEKFLRMLHYFLESLRQFGGPIGRTAKCVVSVSRDEPYSDLFADCPWLNDYFVEIRWVDESLFEEYGYDGTGLDRLFVRSNADIVVLCDADILIAGDLEEVILKSHKLQKLLGFIAVVSPFNEKHLAHISSEDWWRRRGG